MWFEQKKVILFDKCDIPSQFPSQYNHLLFESDDSSRPFESQWVSDFNYEKSETDDSYVLEYPLPGYVKNDIEIYLKDLVLTVSSEKSGRFGYSSFKDEFTVPAGTKEKDISAELKDGLLKVIIKKVEKKELKKIEIK